MAATRLYMSNLFYMPETVRSELTKRIMEKLRTRQLTKPPTRLGSFLEVGDKVALLNDAYISYIQSGKITARQGGRLHKIISFASNESVLLGSPHRDNEEESFYVNTNDIRLATHVESIEGEVLITATLDSVSNPLLIYLMNRCTNHSLRMDLATIASICKSDRDAQHAYVQALYFDQIHKPAEKIHDWVQEEVKKRGIEYPQSIRVSHILEYTIMCFLLNARTFNSHPSSLEFSCETGCNILKEYVLSILTAFKQKVDDTDKSGKPSYHVVDDLFTLELSLLNDLELKDNPIKNTEYYKRMPTRSAVLLHRSIDTYHATEINSESLGLAIDMLPDVVSHLALTTV